MLSILSIHLPIIITSPRVIGSYLSWPIVTELRNNRASRFVMIFHKRLGGYITKARLLSKLWQVFFKSLLETHQLLLAFRNFMERAYTDFEFHRIGGRRRMVYLSRFQKRAAFDCHNCKRTIFVICAGGTCDHSKWQRILFQILWTFKGYTICTLKIMEEEFCRKRNKKTKKKEKRRYDNSEWLTATTVASWDFFCPPAYSSKVLRHVFKNQQILAHIFLYWIYGWVLPRSRQSDWCLRVPWFLVWTALPPEITDRQRGDQTRWWWTNLGWMA